MKISVLYAQHSPFHPNAMFDLMVGNPTNVPYREVATITPEEIEVEEADDNHAVLGRVWRAMNCVDGDPTVEICVRMKVRSMMVGDRVIVERDSAKVTYQCASAGWTILEAS